MLRKYSYYASIMPDAPDIVFYTKKKQCALSDWSSLRSWRDFVRECFCFGSEAVNASGEAVRGLVKSRVEFPPAQISGFF